MFKMWKITYGVGLGFLLLSAMQDVYRRSLWNWWMAAGTLGALLGAILGHEDPVLAAGGAGVGLLFFLISKMTGQQLGYGDSWMILNLGIFCGFWRLLTVLSAAFFLLGIWAMVQQVVGRRWTRWRAGREGLAFIPFLTIGYLGVLLW